MPQLSIEGFKGQNPSGWCCGGFGHQEATEGARELRGHWRSEGFMGCRATSPRLVRDWSESSRDHLARNGCHDELVSALGTAEARAPDAELVNRVRRKLAQLLSVSLEEQTGLQGWLIRALTSTAKDPDVEVARWVQGSVPLGASRHIQSCGVFPPVPNKEGSDIQEQIGHVWYMIYAVPELTPHSASQSEWYCLLWEMFWKPHALDLHCRFRFYRDSARQRSESWP
eukprot:4136247-Amphidinium_carterae.1